MSRDLYDRNSIINPVGMMKVHLPVVFSFIKTNITKLNICLGKYRIVFYLLT